MNSTIILRWIKQLQYLAVHPFPLTSCEVRVRTVEEFVGNFCSELKNIVNVNLNDDIRGYQLLKNSNLDGHDQNIIVWSTGSDRSLRT